MDSLTSGPLYQNTMNIVRDAGKLINLSPNSFERIYYPRRAIVVNVPVKMDDGRLKVYTGYRVQHNQMLGPFKGEFVTTKPSTFRKSVHSPLS